MVFKNYLIFDFGASNGRAVVASFNGKKFLLDEVHRFDNRPVYIGENLFWDVLGLYSELKISIQKSLNKYSNIESLGIDTWGSDFGLLDKNGKLISNPINYRDEQSLRDSKSLYRIIDERELFGLTGADISPIFDLFRLYSLKKNDETAIRHAKTYLSVGDLLNYFLTGKSFNEFTRFTTNVIYNQRVKKIETSILERLGLSKEIFPGFIYPGQKIGDIYGKVSRELEIKPFSVITPSSHDTASAVAGVPSINKDIRWGFISLGTWACLGIENNKVLISDDIYNCKFLNEAGVEDTNIFAKNINGSWIIQQCRNKWLKKKEIYWDEIVALTEKANPFSSFIDVDQPQFKAQQVDMPAIIRDYCKNSGQKIPSSIGDVSRCVYESLCLKFRYYLKFLEKFSGQQLELLHITGGGAQNRLLCQWISNATGKRVIVGPIEATSIGNLLIQLKANTEINNIEEGRRLNYASSKLYEYVPMESAKWEEVYNRFVNLISKR